MTIGVRGVATAVDAPWIEMFHSGPAVSRRTMPFGMCAGAAYSQAANKHGPPLAKSWAGTRAAPTRTISRHRGPRRLPHQGTILDIYDAMHLHVSVGVGVPASRATCCAATDPDRKELSLPRLGVETSTASTSL